MEAGSYSFSSEEFWCTLCQLQLIKFLSHYLVLGMEWQVVWSLFHWWKSWEILHSRPHRRWLWAGKASRVYGYCSLPGCSVPLSRSSEPRGPKGLTVEHSYFLSVFFFTLSKWLRMDYFCTKEFSVHFWEAGSECARFLLKEMEKNVKEQCYYY